MEDLLKHRFLGSTPGFLTQKPWSRDPRMCIYNKFPCDADDGRPGTTLWGPLAQTIPHQETERGSTLARPRTAFVNKVLLAHGHAHLLTCHLQLLSRFRGQDEWLQQRLCGLQSQIYLLIQLWLFIEKVGSSPFCFITGLLELLDGVPGEAEKQQRTPCKGHNLL